MPESYVSPFQLCVLYSDLHDALHQRNKKPSPGSMFLPVDGLYRSGSFVCMLQLSFMPFAFHRIIFQLI